MLRRSLAALAVVLVVAAAFTAGVVAGSASRAPGAGDRPADRLDDAASRIAAQGLSRVDRDALDAAAIQAMLRAAGDQWGTWAVGANGPGLASGYVGIGVWLRTGPDGSVVIAQVSDGSSAARAGVRPGDEVRGVNGHPTAGRSAPLVAAGLRGRAGTVVQLLLRRGRGTRLVSLTRAAVPPPGVTVTLDPVLAGGPALGRIVVPVFTPGVGGQVRAALHRIQAGRATGVILDLRGNPGGLLAEAVETASVFLNRGTVVTYARRDGAEQRLEAASSGDTAMPMVVLVDGGTASAAEVVAGALQDRGRAVLVGSRTFGKGTVQEPVRLADGSALELTVARYRTPSGRSLDGVGLEPDIEVAGGSAPDVAVRRAADVLTGLVADTAPVSGGRG